MTYRALLILVALLMALSAYVGFAVGITAATAPRPAPERTSMMAGSLPPSVQGRTGAPLDPTFVPATATADVRPVGAPLRRAVSSVRLTPAAVQEQPTTAPSDPLCSAPVDALGHCAAASVRETSGIASWHSTGRDGLYAAAGPALRTGDWRGRQVEVCAARCIVVTLNDWCLCVVDGRERLIDLSDESFAALGDLDLGLLSVTVRVP